MIVVFDKPVNERVVYLTAGQNLLKHRVVTLNDNSELIYADSDRLDLLQSFKAITLENKNYLQKTKVACEGYVTNQSWNFDTSRPVYMASNGEITQLIQEDSSLVIIGYPISNKTFFIEFQLPIIRVAELEED